MTACAVEKETAGAAKAATALEAASGPTEPEEPAEPEEPGTAGTAGMPGAEAARGEPGMSAVVSPGVGTTARAPGTAPRTGGGWTRVAAAPRRGGESGTGTDMSTGAVHPPGPARAPQAPHPHAPAPHHHPEPHHHSEPRPRPERPAPVPQARPGAPVPHPRAAEGHGLAEPSDRPRTATGRPEPHRPDDTPGYFRVTVGPGSGGAATFGGAATAHGTDADGVAAVSARLGGDSRSLMPLPPGSATLAPAGPRTAPHPAAPPADTTRPHPAHPTPPRPTAPSTVPPAAARPGAESPRPTGAPAPAAGHRAAPPLTTPGARPRPDVRRVPPALVLAADHTYAARLTTAPGGRDAVDPAWYAERWTLDGPEPYAVPLPLDQPEEAASDVLPLSDGRVLIRRRVADRHAFSLLYPTGPGTGELPLGDLACGELTLLPPSPDGLSAYALVPGDRSTAVWLVAGGAFGPERVAEVPGRCSGGVWLDREGRLLALDRRWGPSSPVKAVAVDLERGGEVTPLLQIAPESDDRLLLADPDSGLLLIRSDAPGEDRLGWGVLGSCLPVRFPECLRLPDLTLTPFAVQPGQMLMPESCAVALRIDGPAGDWVGVWRPSGRRLVPYAAPAGWQAGSGFWSRDAVLHLPYAQDGAPCGVALLEAPADEPHQPATNGTEPSGAEPTPGPCRPVPLGEAPLIRRAVPG
ncbi:hypothetical protein ACIPJM_10125 [Streptomyces halstedii]|uniref:hypothetical protein n=1 Tax=Streptomyces halstedii TaxID=1944 RepID=UPI003803BE19